MNKYTQILILIAIVIIVYGLYNCNCKKRARYSESFVANTSIDDIKKILEGDMTKIQKAVQNNKDLLKTNVDQNKLITAFNEAILKNIRAKNSK
jgi:hypothetical protein